MESNRQLSFLRRFVEAVPEHGLDVNKQWSWQPEVIVDVAMLNSHSPTTEYSTENGED